MLKILCYNAPHVGGPSSSSTAGFKPYLRALDAGLVGQNGNKNTTAAEIGTGTTFGIN